MGGDVMDGPHARRTHKTRPDTRFLRQSQFAMPLQATEINGCGIAQGPLCKNRRPRWPGEPARLVSDPTCARAELGWSPSHPELETIVSHAWRWELALCARLGHAPGSRGCA